MTSAYHFLVVDDIPCARYVVVALLRTLGHVHISEAGDGEQALRLLNSGDPATPIDIVLTDWNMPVMNGMALLRKIRADASLSHLPVLMVTSEGAEDCIAAALRAGADGYLEKQRLGAASLKEALDQILAGRERAA